MRREVRRRWARSRQPLWAEAAMWVVWFIITAAVLLALCLLVTIAWPAP